MDEPRYELPGPFECWRWKGPIRESLDPEPPERVKMCVDLLAGVPSSIIEDLLKEERRAHANQSFSIADAVREYMIRYLQLNRHCLRDDDSAFTTPDPAARPAGAAD